MVVGVVSQAAIHDVGGRVDDAFGREAGVHRSELPVPVGTCTIWYTTWRVAASPAASPGNRLAAVVVEQNWGHRFRPRASMVSRYW
jgi:hypothetical protein